MFEFLEYRWVIFVVLSFSGQFGKLGDVVIDVSSFHFQLVEFGRRFVVGIRVVPILDEVLFEFFPDIDMRGSRYGPSHDPVFYASFPFGYGTSLYKCECVRNLSIWVGHDWCGGVEELIKFEFVHELVGSCPISSERGGLFPF